MTDVGLSRSEADYLKAIHHLLRKEGGERVGTVILAKWLGISAASVTSMVKKLAEAGYVTHSPYQGVALSERGEKAALEMLRHHRLLETFLSEHLGMPWHEVHAEADRLEHALSETLEERLDAVLGHPSVDPHGAPIPAKDGTINAPHTITLWATPPGQIVRVVEVEDEDAALLTHFADLGLVPGAQVAVLTKGPFGGPLHIRVAGHEHALGELVAGAVLITTDDPASPASRSGNFRDTQGE
jgi:DtxR family transcriptional regulator, Mn-dependent transcriptional regulator